MDGLFILIAIPLIFITLIIVIGTSIRFVKSFNHLYEPMANSKLAQFNHKISPVIISFIAPVAGFFIAAASGTPTQYDDTIYNPLSPEHTLTIVIFYVIALVAFWMSLSAREKLSPLLKTFTLLGMGQGFVLCVALTIHFGSHIVFGFIPIIITFPLLSPPLFAMLLFVEIRRQFHLFKQAELAKEEDVIYDSLVLSTAEKIVNSKYLENPFLFFLLIPFLAIQQGILILFGQQPDSFIKAFTETCTYTFSQLPPPPDPGNGHYLCTIASRGSEKLVKPIRKGWRGGRTIDVNRQLMIANAFEEWLEEYCPVFHTWLRKQYNSFAQPLNDIVQSKNISNIVFIIMKPFEWFFLLWLYIADEKPENRIHKQYLPSK